jgi:hypothetical protein
LSKMVIEVSQNPGFRFSKTAAAAVGQARLSLSIVQSSNIYSLQFM